MNFMKYLISIEQFFDEFDLKDLFEEKEYEPILKSAIIKLNNYFEEHKDKLKLFKEIDLDKNGFLSVEEFMTLLNSLDDLNLEDNQKLKLLKVADKNKDGKINSKEFLFFIKSAKYLSDKNSINEMKSTFPQINKNIAIERTNFIPRYLDDKSLVEKNLEINESIYKELNGFLKTIIILQKDIVDNFFNFDCIEQDFTIADNEQSGKVSYSRFNSILKKRLFRLKDSNFMRMINFANYGLDENVIQQLNENKVIDYKNFLSNLINYNEKGKDKKDWEEDEIDIKMKEQKEEEEEKKEEQNKEEENKEEEIEEGKNEKEIDNEEEIKEENEDMKLGGELIKEQQVEKNGENEFDNFINNAISENKEENEIKEKESKDIIQENEPREIIQENDMIDTNRFNEVNVGKEVDESELEKSKENEINKEEEKKSEETRGIINEENNEIQENNNLESKIGNNLVEENRIEKE